MQLAELPIPEPGPGQVLIRVEATGVNFIEVYFRKGTYKAALPLVPVTGNQLLSATGIKVGQMVMVVGAVGNVGRSAVFTAKEGGATVMF